MLAYEGDGIDISGRMQYHRGTVQNQMSHTLQTGGVEGVVVDVGKVKKRNCKRQGENEQR